MNPISAALNGPDNHVSSSNILSVTAGINKLSLENEQDKESSIESQMYDSICENLLSQRVENLRQNELKMLIKYQKEQREKDQKKFDELFLFLKRQYAISQDDHLFDKIK